MGLKAESGKYGNSAGKEDIVGCIGAGASGELCEELCRRGCEVVRTRLTCDDLLLRLAGFGRVLSNGIEVTTS